MSLRFRYYMCVDGGIYGTPLFDTLDELDKENHGLQADGGDRDHRQQLPVQ